MTRLGPSGVSSSPTSGSDSQPSQYGDSFAEVYDQWYGSVTNADATARFVADRCPQQGGTVLELGVGTGRLAIPLAQSGLEVWGIDASMAMLRLCPNHQGVHKICGDMAAVPAKGQFNAVLIGFNTIFNLTTATAQKLLFHQMRKLVAPTGMVIIETFNPATIRWESGSTTDLNRRNGESVTVVATSVDRDAQQIKGCHLTVDDAGYRFRPWSLRWSYLEELDQWATSAGFGRPERFGGWEAEAATEDSPNVISLYRPDPSLLSTPCTPNLEAQ